MEGDEVATNGIVWLGAAIEKIYFRNGKVEYHGLNEKGDTTKHFYGKISSQPLKEK